MKKLLTIGTALALTLTFAAAGCKKKDEKKGTESTKPEGAQPAAPAPAPAAPAAAPAAPAAPAAAATGTGVPECDEYVATFEKISKCDKLGPAADGLKQGYEATKAGWAGWASMDEAARKAAQTAAAPGCKAGTDALKTTATSMGCEI
ncbi:MAG: hypothetical protein R3B06_00890 [Kofleriaceae bacterium]